MVARILLDAYDTGVEGNSCELESFDSSIHEKKSEIKRKEISLDEILEMLHA